MADVVEQSLLLPKDMVNLRSMRQHEVFLKLKRDLAIVSLLSFFLFFSFFLFLTVLIILFRPFKPHLGPRR